MSKTVTLIPLLGAAIISILTSFRPHLKDDAEPISTQRMQDGGLNDLDEVHWFYVRVRLDRARNIFHIVGSATQIHAGTRSNFDKELWHGITRGQLAIGPFWDMDEARDARKLFKHLKRNVKINEARSDKEMHWFAVTFTVRLRSHAYRLERTPNRIESGTQEEFVDLLFENMTFRKLTVGPFWDYNEAEEAKDYYKQNEYKTRQTK